MGREKTQLFDDPRNVRRLLRALYLCCAGLLLVEAALHRHAERAWEGVWGFYAAYGFVGCVVLVLIAKGMRRLLMRPEDYYGSVEPPPTKEAPDADS